MSFSNTLEPQATQLPAISTAAVWIGAAPTDGSRWVLNGVAYSYSAAPAAASTLVISWTDGSTNYAETYYISAGGPDYLPLFREFAANMQVTITLAASTGIYGSVYPTARTQND